MVLSVFKLHFSKAKAKEISYRGFGDFKENNEKDLQNRLSAQSVEYTPFEKIFLDDLNKHALLKKKLFVQIMHRI